MEKYFEILPNSNAYDVANKLFHFKDKWYNPKVRDEIKTETGFTKVAIWPSSFQTTEQIPENMKFQFKKNKNESGMYEAKKLSDINKKFLEIVKKYDLKYYHVFDLTVTLGENDFDKLLGGQVSAYIPITVVEPNRYFIQTKDGVNAVTLDFLSKHPVLKEIDIEEMVKLRKLQEAV